MDAPGRRCAEVPSAYRPINVGAQLAITAVRTAESLPLHPFGLQHAQRENAQSASLCRGWIRREAESNVGPEGAREEARQIVSREVSKAQSERFGYSR